MSFCLGSVASGLAAPMLTMSGGQLTGATGLDVGGTPYDVTIMDGTCVDLFSGCDEASDFPFADLTEANTAVTEIFNLINGSIFENAPPTVLGCSIAVICTIYTPTLPLGANDTISAALISIFAANPLVQASTLVGRTLGPSIGFTYAKWTPSAPIPEPTTMMLLSTGLLGLVGYRWRQGRRERQQVG